jgi:pyridoxamine 5'-phosphate oxidase
MPATRDESPAFPDLSRSLAEIRSDYARAGLDERDLSPSPLDQLQKWLGDAIEAKHPEPTAMTVATITPDGGEPSQRVVLLKGLDARGLVFFTNYDSDKGREIAKHPRVAANLFWVLLERQIRVSGSIEKVTREESIAYFKSRPRDSQLGAWASRQSAVLSGRAELEQRMAETRARFGENEVPCPEHWGGYRIVPSRVEFWQGRPSRLHDRLRYTKDETLPSQSWKVERLSP